MERRSDGERMEPDLQYSKYTASDINEQLKPSPSYEDHQSGTYFNDPPPQGYDNDTGSMFQGSVHDRMNASIQDQTNGQSGAQVCASPQGDQSMSSSVPSCESMGNQPCVHSGPVIVPTGIYVLDRNLGGGLPISSMVYFTADPRSMSEVFLYQFTQSRKTYYFTTSRKPKYVQQDIMNLNFNPYNIVFIDVYSEYYYTPLGDMIDNVGNEFVDSKIVEFTEYNLLNIQNEAKEEPVNIIFDNFSFFMGLNVNPGLLKRLTNLLYETTKETNSLTYLYGLKGSHDTTVENDVLNAADVIFDVDIERKADKMISKLAIPKIRGMIPNAELIKFNVGEGVQIDTSRDIA